MPHTSGAPSPCPASLAGWHAPGSQPTRCRGATRPPGQGSGQAYSLRSNPLCASTQPGAAGSGAGLTKREQEREMTTKAAFSPEEWKVVLEGPPSAGMIVVTAAHGGMFKETVAMSKAYVEARSQHGASELLDEIVAAKPAMDHTRYHSVEELRDNGLEHLRSAVTLLEGKATAGEVDDYRRFVVALANEVAAAHREDGQDVSPAEADAVQQITAALGTTAQ